LWKIFNMQRFESIKELIFILYGTGFVHMYDLAHIKFLWMVYSKFSCCIPFHCCSELCYQAFSNLLAVHGVQLEHITCWCSAVMSHFKHIVMDVDAIYVFFMHLLAVSSFLIVVSIL
jgi:hypothetical protein